jgi:CRP-like cAMP-binding protein
MQTGKTQIDTPMSLLAPVPSLYAIYRKLGEVKAKKCTQTSPWRSIQEMFSERLRMRHVKKGGVIYEQGARGLQMFFIYEGNVEILQWIAGSTDEKMLVGEQAECIQSSVRMITEKNRLLDNAIPSLLRSKKTETQFSFDGHRADEAEMFMLDRIKVVCRLDAGAQFGELGLLQGKAGSPRLGSAVAVEDTTLFSLHADDLSDFAEVGTCSDE